VPLLPSSTIWYRTKAMMLVASEKVTAGLAESNGSLPPRLWMTAKRLESHSSELRSISSMGQPLTRRSATADRKCASNVALSRGGAVQKAFPSETVQALIASVTKTCVQRRHLSIQYKTSSHFKSRWASAASHSFRSVFNTFVRGESLNWGPQNLAPKKLETDKRRLIDWVIDW